MTNGSNFKWGVIPDSKPKRSNNIYIDKGSYTRYHIVLYPTRKRQAQDNKVKIFVNDNKANSLTGDGDIKKNMEDILLRTVELN